MSMSASLVALLLAVAAPAQIAVVLQQRIVAVPVDRRVMERAALSYATFWDTGDAALARAALAPDFVDRTLPPGRAQGVVGALAALRRFRAAVPDLHGTVEQLILAGERVVTHLHFTGRFGERQGQGQPVDFIATDIYRVADGRIAENWHIEGNLTLLRPWGEVTP